MLASRPRSPRVRSGVLSMSFSRAWLHQKRSRRARTRSSGGATSRRGRVVAAQVYL